MQINVHDDERPDIQKFKEFLKIKFTSLRVLPEYSEQENQENYQLTATQEKKLKEKSILKEMLHQYYYSDERSNVYSMIYLLLKFQVFPKRTVIIVPDINEAYR